MNQFYKNISLWLVIVLMMVMLYNIFNQQQAGQVGEHKSPTTLGAEEIGKTPEIAHAYRCRGQGENESGAGPPLAQRILPGTHRR